MTRASNGGIALVSVIVAAGILAIAISMAASALISGAHLARQSAHLTSASNFAEGTLERVTSEAFESISTREVTKDMPELPSAKCLIEVVPRGSGLKEVTVTVSWLEKEGPRKVRLSTLLAKGAVR